MQIKSVRDLDIQGKKVLLRVDYNVPISMAGEIEDTTRIEETLPTMKYLLDQDAAIILMSHLGRPKGRPDSRFSLRNVADALKGFVRQEVGFVQDCIGPKVEGAARILGPGMILLLENLRFHPEEEKNDESFARSLASLGDVYVNDAFGASHRAHASIVGILKFKPAAAGFLLETELKVLNSLVTSPKRPYLAVLGGVKISDKLAVLRNLADHVEVLFVGGAMAFTLLKSLGYFIGKSPVEDNFLGEAALLLKKYRDKICLPMDCLAAPSKESPGQARAIAFSKDRDEMRNLQGLDLGPQSIEAYTTLIKKSNPRTVFWNGPMGVFEVPEFAKGTLETAKALGECAKSGAEVVVGGGDLVAAVKKLGLAKEMTHLSTGGGASLEFLEGKTLPGIAALQAAASVMKA